MIEAYFELNLQNGQKLAYEENNKFLFTYKDVSVYLKGDKDLINDSENITFYTSVMPNSNESFEIIKQIFNNVILNLIRHNASISLKNGNFERFEPNCIEIYKFINIKEVDKKESLKPQVEILGFFRSYQLDFDKVEEYAITKEISDAIFLKMYSDLLFWNREIPQFMYNSIIRACFEKLIPVKEYKNDEELEIIDMAKLFIYERYKDSPFCSSVLRSLDVMREKSKNQKVRELIENHVKDKTKLKEYKKLISENQKHRGLESHEFSEKVVKPIWVDHVFYTVLHDICLNGFKDSTTGIKNSFVESEE